MWRLRLRVSLCGNPDPDSADLAAGRKANRSRCVFVLLEAAWPERPDPACIITSYESCWWQLA